MILFQWKPDYEIHFDKVDAQHKSLVGMINDLYAAKKTERAASAVGVTLDKLLDYVNTHFRDEEEAMAQWQYPGLREHRMQHRELEKEVHELRQKHLNGHGVATFELLNFLSEWFKVHIIESDMQFGAFVSRVQQQQVSSQ